MTVRRTLSTFLAVSFLLWMAQPRLFARTGRRTELTVFAAASLTEAFQTLGRNFEEQHPSTRILFNFGGSQQLVQQVVHGAEADILALANMKQMNIAIAAGVIDTPSVRVFARNRLVIILPADNPAHLMEIKDLAKADVKIVLADSSVPAGQYALQILDKCSHSASFGKSFKDRVLSRVVSYEENVRAVFSKVQLGECDAGIVYSSDIAHDSVRRVQHIDIPDSLNMIAQYPLAIVLGTTSHQSALEFLEYVLSTAGEGVLSTFGFLGASTSKKR